MDKYEKLWNLFSQAILELNSFNKKRSLGMIQDNLLTLENVHIATLLFSVICHRYQDRKASWRQGVKPKERIQAI